MTQADREALHARAKRLLDAESPAIDELLRTAKQLYVSDMPVESGKLERRARVLARAQAEALPGGARIDAASAKPLAKCLNRLNEHALARQILARVREQHPEDVVAAQQLALSTYKDEELPPDARFADALGILDAIGLRDPACADPETLGQGGAIHKRMWERGGQIEDLHTALHFYRGGWQADPRRDMGYCGVNAAFILDVLAYRARIAVVRDRADARYAEAFEAEACAMREAMLQRLPEFAADDAETRAQYWYLVTMAEVNFGLGRWEQAADRLAQARQAEHAEWERQTTARQLVAIARMHGFLPPTEAQAPETWDAPWRALHALLGADALAAFDSYRGKVGLALSGGGFRASLFHLGVLARLAECDALRCVEVLSTVSGGSIVGAHYYLALRHRLRTNTDAELDRAAYLGVVREVMDQFCAGVHLNLRVRALSNLWSNLKMLLTRTYGRSNRMGELYEKFLYDAVPDGQAPGKLRRLRDLLIHPLLRRGAAGAPEERDEDFKPRFSNWRRKARVPILLLNATSLNSGHNWPFTASWMGEPPGLTGQEIDMNQRYRRLYYWQAPIEKLRDHPLGYAVAASAGVPALFDPLVLDGLYPERTVRLVDGGVHDNQGVAGLLDEGCSLILCSDASGQMDDQKSPAGGVLGVFLRSDSILQDRLREAQYQDLAWRAQSQSLQGFFFVHLKQGLESDPIDWVECQDPGRPVNRPRCTDYAVDRTIQRLLSEVRTDLDTFTEVEACALMASGYRMTEHQLRQLDKAHKASGLPGTWAGFDVDAPSANDWPFSPLLPVMAADPKGGDMRARDLTTQLTASKMLFGKVWKLVPALSGAAIVLAAICVAGAGVWIYRNWQSTFSLSYELSVRGVVIGVVVLLAGLVMPLGKLIKPLETVRKWLFMVFLATVGWVLTNIHLWFFEPLFRRRGGLERLMKLAAGSTPAGGAAAGAPFAYRLSGGQLEQAIEVLGQARSTFQLTPGMQRLYTLLRLSVHAGTGAFVCLVVGIIWDLSGSGGRVELGAIDWVILAVLAVALLSSPLLLLLNVPLVGQIVRQRARLRRLGLRDLSIAMWRAHRKKRRWESIWLGVVAVVGALVLLSATMLFAMGDATVGFSILWLLLLLGGPFVGYYFVQRAKDQLELAGDANRLLGSLQQLQKGAGADEDIDVPAEAWASVAQIESAQIARQRVEAVAEGITAPSQEYRVLTARDVAAAKAELGLQDRLAVEDLVDEVGENPRAPEAVQDETDGLWRRRFANGEMALVYGIDEAQRQVRIVALHRTQAAETVAAQSLEDRHA